MNTKTLATFLGGVVILLFVVAVILSQSIFLTNVSIALFNQNINDLDRQNKEMSVQVAKLESIETILPLALKQGFVENSSVLYLDTTDKLARNE